MEIKFVMTVQLIAVATKKQDILLMHVMNAKQLKTESQGLINAARLQHQLTNVKNILGIKSVMTAKPTAEAPI